MIGLPQASWWRSNQDAVGGPAQAKGSSVGNLKTSTDVTITENRDATSPTMLKPAEILSNVGDLKIGADNMSTGAIVNRKAGR